MSITRNTTRSYNARNEQPIKKQKNNIFSSVVQKDRMRRENIENTFESMVLTISRNALPCLFFKHHLSSTDIYETEEFKNKLNKKVLRTQQQDFNFSSSLSLKTKSTSIKGICLGMSLAFLKKYWKEGPGKNSLSIHNAAMKASQSLRNGATVSSMAMQTLLRMFYKMPHKEHVERAKRELETLCVGEMSPEIIQDYLVILSKYRPRIMFNFLQAISGLTFDYVPISNVKLPTPPTTFEPDELAVAHISTDTDMTEFLNRIPQGAHLVSQKNPEKGRAGHAIVIIKDEENTLHVFDPNIGLVMVREDSYNTFAEKWLPFLLEAGQSKTWMRVMSTCRANFNNDNLT